MSEGEGGKGRSVELCESVEGMWWPRMGGGEDHGDVDGEGEVGGVKNLPLKNYVHERSATSTGDALF